MKMLDLQVDAPVASSWFVLPTGYRSADPTVTGNIPTAVIKSGQTPQATATVLNPQPSTGPGKILIIASNDQVTVSDPDVQNTHAYPVKPNVLAASLSPDGKKVAYESEEQLGHVIFLLDLETGVSTQVSQDEILGYTETILWTRAGDQLIFSATVGGSLIFQIYSLDLVSGAMTPLTHFTTGSLDTSIVLSSWSMDEATIGFTTVDLPPTAGHSQDILQTLDVKSGEIKTILDQAHAGDIELLGGSYLTPDGKSIFFEGRHNGRFRIFRIDVDGTHLEEVTSDDLPYDIQGPIVFSPDGGSFFAYAADQNKNNSNLVPTLFLINGDLIRQLSDVSGRVVSWIDIGK
jgi:Tol biopolymer transport system component